MATSAAYDLRKEDGKPQLPMLWHYQVVAAHQMERTRSRWPDRREGQEYVPIILEVANERLERAYADEAEFTAPLPPHVREALGGAVPLLVRIQYMNECHALNGAAAMALVRHAACCGVRWTLGGVPVADIGWQWGACADGASLVICNEDAQTGQQRVKHQAHAHQLVTVRTADGDTHILDLSIAQFGSGASLRSVAGLVDPAAGCSLSPTLAASCSSTHRSTSRALRAWAPPHTSTAGGARRSLRRCASTWC